MMAIPDKKGGRYDIETDCMSQLNSWEVGVYRGFDAQTTCLTLTHVRFGGVKVRESIGPLFESKVPNTAGVEDQTGDAPPRIQQGGGFPNRRKFQGKLASILQDLFPLLCCGGHVFAVVVRQKCIK
jgi:hypothetical protein